MPDREPALAHEEYYGALSPAWQAPTTVLGLLLIIIRTLRTSRSLLSIFVLNAAAQTLIILYGVEYESTATSTALEDFAGVFLNWSLWTYMLVSLIAASAMIYAAIGLYRGDADDFRENLRRGITTIPALFVIDLYLAGLTILYMVLLVLPSLLLIIYVISDVFHIENTDWYWYPHGALATAGVLYFCARFVYSVPLVSIAKKWPHKALWQSFRQSGPIAGTVFRLYLTFALLALAGASIYELVPTFLRRDGSDLELDATLGILSDHIFDIFDTCFTTLVVLVSSWLYVKHMDRPSESSKQPPPLPES